MIKIILTVSLLLLSVNSIADVLKVGDTLPPIELNNQHGQPITVSPTINTLIFSVEKSAADLLNDYLATQEGNFLKENNAYFLADISGMPGIITRVIALPKMRKRPYDMLLATEAEQLSFIPHKKNWATALKIVDGKITSITFLDNPEQMDSVFK